MSKKKTPDIDESTKFGTIEPDPPALWVADMAAREEKIAAFPGASGGAKARARESLPPAPRWVTEDEYIAAIRLAFPEGFNGEEQVVIRHFLRTLARQRPPRVTTRRHKEHGWWEYEVTIPVTREAAIAIAAQIAELRLHDTDE